TPRAQGQESSNGGPMKHRSWIASPRTFLPRAPQNLHPSNPPPWKTKPQRPTPPARKVIEKAEPDLYDPFAPENLKLPQEFLDQTMATSLLTVIPVERPSDQTFIRVHPSPDYRFVAALITHHDEKGARYLVHPTFVGQIGSIKYHLEQLYLYTDRQGRLAFWPIKFKQDNRENTWLDSAHAAAEAAIDRWVCITTKQQARMYHAAEAEGIFPDPDWEKITQGKNLNELL